jgi:hypothetical protein
MLFVYKDALDFSVSEPCYCGVWAVKFGIVSCVLLPVRNSFKCYIPIAMITCEQWEIGSLSSLRTSFTRSTYLCNIDNN